MRRSEKIVAATTTRSVLNANPGAEVLNSIEASPTTKYTYGLASYHRSRTHLRTDMDVSAQPRAAMTMSVIGERK